MATTLYLLQIQTPDEIETRMFPTLGAAKDAGIEHRKLGMASDVFEVVLAKDSGVKQMAVNLYNHEDYAAYKKHKLHFNPVKVVKKGT